MRLKPVFDPVGNDGATLLRFTGVDKTFTPRLARRPGRRARARSTAGRRDPGLRSATRPPCAPWSARPSRNGATKWWSNKGWWRIRARWWALLDPHRPRQSPQAGPGGTIAHGALGAGAAVAHEDPAGLRGHGLRQHGQLRLGPPALPSPVPAGARIRARARVKSVERMKSGTQLVLEVHTHVVGAERPSVINDLVILYM